MKTKHLTPEELGRETEKLIDFKAEMKHMYAMSAGKEGTKKLFITGAGNFIVEVNGNEVLRTIQPFTAIEKYYES